MQNICKFLIIPAVLIYLLIISYAQGNEDKEEITIKQKKSSDSIFNNFFIFPQIGLQIEDRIFAGNNAGYRMKLNRIFDLDILRMNNIVLSMFVNEFSIYNNDSSKHIYPRSINYEMDYANLRWENEYGILSLFADHNCTNSFNDNMPKTARIRWYGAGIRWESYGMKPGQKNVRNSQKFKKLNYRLSISKAINTKVLTYDYLITANLRYDILKYNFVIPYIEASALALVDNRARFDRGIEAGFRMCFEKGDIAPFAGLNHKYDTDHYKSKAINLYFIGLRFETLLKYDSDQTKRNKDTKETPIYASLFPDIHFKGGYGKYIDNDNLNFNTDIFMGLDFLSDCKFSPFVNHTLAHNSQKQDAGMFPRYIEQNIEGGVSCKSDYINVVLEPYYAYTRCDEGNYYNSNPQRFSSAGVRFISRNMKTGYANKGINFDDMREIEQINTIDWSVSAERVFNKFYYKYSWEYNISARWNILRYHKSVPYISAALCLLMDKGLDKIYNIEAGIRIQSGLQWMLFYRYEYRTAVDQGNGLFKYYNLIGIKFEI